MRTAAKGLIVFGQRDELVTFDDARRLGEVDNGLVDELVQPGPLRPLLSTPVHTAVEEGSTPNRRSALSSTNCKRGGPVCCPNPASATWAGFAPG